MDERLSFRNGTDRGNDLRRVAIFEEIARRPGSHEVKNILLLLIHGQSHHPDMRELPLDNAGGFDPCHPGHTHIHENDIRQQGSSLFDRIATIFGFTDDLNIIFRFENRREPFSHHTMIIDNQDFSFFWHNRFSPLWRAGR